MSRRPISPEQGPTSRQLAAFTDGELAPEQREQVWAWLAGHPEAQARAAASASANRRLLRLFRATRPEGPSPEAWEESLARIESALRAGRAPPGGARPVQALADSVAIRSVTSITRERS